MKNIFVFFLFYYLDASILRNIRRKTRLTKYLNPYKSLIIKPLNNPESIDHTHVFTIQFCINSDSKIECKLFSYALHTSNVGLLIALDKDSSRKINVGFVYAYKAPKNESLPLHSLLDCKRKKIHFFDFYIKLNGKKKYSTISFNVLQNNTDTPITNIVKNHILPNKSPNNNIKLIIIDKLNSLLFYKEAYQNSEVKNKSYTNSKPSFAFKTNDTKLVNNNTKGTIDETINEAENEKSQKCLFDYYVLNSDQSRQFDQNSSDTNRDELSTIEDLSVSSSSSFSSISNRSYATKNNPNVSAPSLSNQFRQFDQNSSDTNQDELSTIEDLSVSSSSSFSSVSNRSYATKNNPDVSALSLSNNSSNENNENTNTPAFVFACASFEPDPENISKHYLNKISEDADREFLNDLNNNGSSLHGSVDYDANNTNRFYYDANIACFSPKKDRSLNKKKRHKQLEQLSPKEDRSLSEEERHKQLEQLLDRFNNGPPLNFDSEDETNPENDNDFLNDDKSKNNASHKSEDSSVLSISPLDDFKAKTDAELLSSSREDVARDLIKLYDAVAHALRHNKEYKEPIKNIVEYYIKISEQNQKRFFVEEKCFVFKNGHFSLRKKQNTLTQMSKLSPEEQEKKLKNSTIHCDLKDLETNIKNIAQLYLYEQNQEDLAALKTIATEWRDFRKTRNNNKTSKTPHKDKINLLNYLRNKLKLIVPRLLSFYAPETRQQVIKNYSDLHQKMLRLRSDINDENNESFMENVQDIEEKLKIFKQPIPLGDFLVNFKVTQENTTIKKNSMERL